MALHISLIPIVLCYIFKIRLEGNYFFFTVLKKFFDCYQMFQAMSVLVLNNNKSSTRLVCHDSNYVNIYLINVKLCVKSQVGRPEAGITGQRFCC